MGPDVAPAIEDWIASLPEEATAERVRVDFWYVRLPGTARRWIPLEIEVGERTVKVTSHMIIEPDERHADVYRLLLRYNHEASGVAFSIDGREGVICLVGRIAIAEASAAALDAMAGRIVARTESTFRTILRLGFAGRLARSRP